MTAKGIWSSPTRIARMAGFLYLAFFITFTLADTGVHSTFVDSKNTAALVENIMASEGQFRLGFFSFALSAMFFLLSAWALYVLLKPVDSNLALLVLVLNLCGVAIKCASLMGDLGALLLLSDADYLSALQPDQLQALAGLFLNVFGTGFMIAQLFFAAWLLPLGYLVYKSGFLPRILGGLLILDFVAILLWFIQFFLFPDYEALSYPGLAISFIAEASLCLWLLVKGVNAERWEQLALGFT
jgi:hypothetical protein